MCVYIHTLTQWPYEDMMTSGVRRGYQDLTPLNHLIMTTSPQTHTSRWGLTLKGGTQQQIIY